MGDKNSKSLLANVLDLDGDFILAPNSHPFESHESEPGYGVGGSCQPLPPTYVPHNESALSLSASSSWDSRLNILKAKFERFGAALVYNIKLVWVEV